MREKLEQALAGITGRYEQTVLNERSGSPEYKSWERWAVDAILDAMMEPSEEMVLEGQSRPPEHIGWDIPTGESVIYRWQAMIKSAKEG